MNLSPLDRLEQDVVNDSVALSSLLRQTMVIGGRASSPELRLWALQELDGYGDPSTEIPAYRMLEAALRMDWTSGRQRWKGYPISVVELPERMRANMTGPVPLPFPVAEIQAMIDSAEPGQPVELGPGGMVEAARLMTQRMREQGNPLAAVHSVYWAVAPASLQGVLDRVRTRLTLLVSELRATMQPGEIEPTPEQMQKGVQNFWIMTGNNSPVNIAAPLAVADRGAEASASVEGQTEAAGRPGDGEKPRWRR